MPPTRRQAYLLPKILVRPRPYFWAYLDPPKPHLFLLIRILFTIFGFFFMIFPIVALLWFGTSLGLD